MHDPGLVQAHLRHGSLVVFLTQRVAPETNMWGVHEGQWRENEKQAEGVQHMTVVATLKRKAGAGMGQRAKVVRPKPKRRETRFAQKNKTILQCALTRGLRPADGFIPTVVKSQNAQVVWI